MTQATMPLTIQGDPLAWLQRLFRTEPLFAGTAIVIAITMLPTTLALMLEPRLFQSENLWIKPLKFQFALTVYLLTLAFYARWLPPAMLRAQWYRIFAWSVVTAIVLESVWINTAAAFGTASHFNTNSDAMEAIYGLMGLLATLLTSATTVYGFAILRNANTGLSDGMRHALGAGLLLTLPLTLITAGYLASSTGHFVGEPITHSTLPLIGWSTEVGDLRVAHFFGTHALHIIPIVALILAAKPRLSWIIATAFAVFTLAVFAQAIAGLPLIAL